MTERQFREIGLFPGIVLTVTKGVTMPFEYLRLNNGLVSLRQPFFDGWLNMKTEVSNIAQIERIKQTSRDIRSMGERIERDGRRLI